MKIVFPTWPPAEFHPNDWPSDWLRFEKQYPGSGRPSRLAAHAGVPYVAVVNGEPPDASVLGQVASNYLDQLENYLPASERPLIAPKGWVDAIKDRLPDSNGDLPAKTAAEDLMHWLNVWPAVGSATPVQRPRVASWNLSRQDAHNLPANIILATAEFLNGTGFVESYSFGIRVPMRIEPTANGFTVTIRSMTAEFPQAPNLSWTELISAYTPPANSSDRAAVLSSMLAGFAENPSNIRYAIGAAAAVEPSSIEVEEVWLLPPEGASFARDPKIYDVISKARGSIPRSPNRLSYRVVNRIRLLEGNEAADAGSQYQLLSTETCELVTHAGQGEVNLFTQVPPAVPIADVPVPRGDPGIDYDWTQRRPSRSDDVLQRYWDLFLMAPGDGKTLKDSGFNVRLCPQFVPDDKLQAGNANNSKVLHLPTDRTTPPRRNEFSAASAYFHSFDFFGLLSAYGIAPKTFVVRAKTDIQVFYRYGITPGPGKDGKTVNAQVAFDCKEQALLPEIRMNLALGDLARWSRPLHNAHHDDHDQHLPQDHAAHVGHPGHHVRRERTWAQPLGIASDRRWILHEFGHYLLAARLGKLEFDFAHSPGDAMAAVFCDPESRLGDPQRGVADSFRGITYPFVFSTRRHDRTPQLGWAWYGQLNRDVIQAPPSSCEQTKGYLTEQILSSSVFRLYRALGGDTLDEDGAPDIYIRQRASFVTLFLLIRAIHGLVQSPSRAEMLELAMEDAGLSMGAPLLMVPQPITVPPLPQPDQWQGGVTHKVVRWAFETQGMFPADPLKTHNAAGRPPPVDIYIRDQRPEDEIGTEGRMEFGPGSYAPVSLDWAVDAKWQFSGMPFIGNRGTATATDIGVRIWLGVTTQDPAQNWGLTTPIFWADLMSDSLAGPLGALQEHPIFATVIQDAVNAANFQDDPVLLVLIEVSCPDDPANTSPQADLAVRVDTVADLPTTPRALTDLVANDNNLGLRVFRAP